MTIATVRALAQCMGTAVTGWKVADHGQAIARPAQSSFTGVMYRLPEMGQGLMVYRTQGDTLMTSPVHEVSMDADGGFLVETMNSTYRLVFNPDTPELHRAA